MWSVYLGAEGPKYTKHAERQGITFFVTTPHKVRLMEQRPHGLLSVLIPVVCVP